MNYLNVEIGFPKTKPEVEYDPAGWLCGDTKKNLLRAIKQTDPTVICEIGSWLGLSSRFLVNESDAQVYCLDHWQGSIEHKHEKHAHKLPLLWETFCMNNWSYKERIIPVKADSEDGLNWLFREGIEPDIFYVDGSHEYEDVKRDIIFISEWWPDAVIVGDDYIWEGVHSAVHDCSKLLNKRLHVEGRKSWAFFNEGPA